MTFTVRVDDIPVYFVCFHSERNDATRIDERELSTHADRQNFMCSTPRCGRAGEAGDLRALPVRTGNGAVSAGQRHQRAFVPRPAVRLGSIPLTAESTRKACLLQPLLTATLRSSPHVHGEERAAEYNSVFATWEAAWQGREGL